MKLRHAFAASLLALTAPLAVSAPAFAQSGSK
jgi:hypothetical protein